MFFLLSKIFWFFAAPTAACFLLLGVGLLAAIVRWRRAALCLLSLGALGLILFGATPLSRALVRPLEDRFPIQADDGRRIDGIIVLGGAIGSARGQVKFSDGASRMTMAVALAQRHPEAKLLFSGGSSQIIGTVRHTESDDAGQFFSEMGLAPARVLLENRSRNTYENATLSAAMAQAKPGERWVLITSAYHMPRAMGVFRKAGMTVEAWPVDFHTAGDWKDYARPVHRFSWQLTLADDAVKEWIGLLAYRWAGYTDALLPAP